MSESKYAPVILGANPAGSFLAAELAKKGQVSVVLEENGASSDFGGISGLLHSDFPKITNLKKSDISMFRINEIKKLSVHFPSDDVISFSLKNPYLVADYGELAKLFHSIAESYGAKFYFGNRLEKFVVADYVIGRTNKLRFQAEVLVAADKPDSEVAKKYGVEHKYLYAVESHCNYISSANEIHILVGKKFSEVPYAWVVPEDQNTARIGMLCTDFESGKARLNKLLHYIDAKPLNVRVSKVPADFNSNHTFERIMLLGDAGAHSKANSLGEMNSMIFAANHARDTILKAYEMEDFSEKFLKTNYSDKINQEIGPVLKNSLKARRMSELLKDSGWNKVQKYLLNPEVKSKVEKASDVAFLDSVVSGIGNDKKSNWLIAKLAVTNPGVLRIFGI